MVAGLAGRRMRRGDKDAPGRVRGEDQSRRTDVDAFTFPHLFLIDRAVNRCAVTEYADCRNTHLPECHAFELIRPARPALSSRRGDGESDAWLAADLACAEET